MELKVQVQETVFTLMLMTTLAVLGASSTATSIENRASHYADFLTNVTFRLTDYDIYLESLDSIRKNEFYNPEAMAMALVPMVKRGVASTNAELHSLAIDAINAMGRFRLTNALPLLTDLALKGDGRIPIVAFAAYGEISSYNENYLGLGLQCVKRGVLNFDYLAGCICCTLSMDNEQRLAVPLSSKTRLLMIKTLFEYIKKVPPSGEGYDSSFCRAIPEYSNSQERVFYLQKILEGLDKVPGPGVGVRQLYLFDGKGYEFDDWTNNIRTRCKGELERIERLPKADPTSVAEIKRTRGIPENERLNMTAILDAKIAAIEAAEARAARRAVWKRRLRIGTLVLPIPVIALAAIVARRRRSRCI